jgi:hypothetical protein
MAREGEKEKIKEVGGVFGGSVLSLAPFILQLLFLIIFRRILWASFSSLLHQSALLFPLFIESDLFFFHVLHDFQ